MSAPDVSRHIHPFGSGVRDASVLGRVGAGMACLAALELPLVEGFTIGTGAIGDPDGLPEGLRSALTNLERRTDHVLGDPDRPLLLSVVGCGRTFRHLGLNAEVIAAIAERSPQTARAIEREWREDLEQLGLSPGESPNRLLLAVVEALWAHDDPAPAVTVRVVAPPRPDVEALRGVAWSRDPDTGTPVMTGMVEQMPARRSQRGIDELADVSASAHTRLRDALLILESALRDVCEVQFVVRDHRLWLTSVMPAPRSPAAAVRIAVDLVDDGLIGIRTALHRVPLDAITDLPSSPADPALARLLAWCDEEARVPVVDVPPAGSVLVGSAAELAEADGQVALRLMDSEWLSRPVSPPAAEWTAVVAPARLERPARLLSARLRCLS